ncbi:MAG TPA: glycosyltransferase family A protein [Thermoleophilia bacterium]|nr:glycosyltransferase family A protein [Thermoleophilia bacterium]
MKPPLISCIVPVFNGERYLGEALESIRAQTYRPLEIIVADDGSTDGTATVVAGFAEPVRYLFQPNAGPAAARNLGLGAAQGEYVAFLDADDLLYPEKLARQMARFQARLDLDLCVTYVRNFWTPELAQEEAHYRDHPRAQAMPGYYTSTLLAKRALFDTVSQFNNAYRHGDATEWFVRVAERAAVVELLPDVLTYHRMHDANLSRRMASGSLDEYLRILKASLDHRRHHNAGAPLPYGFPASGWRGEP